MRSILIALVLLMGVVEAAEVKRGGGAVWRGKKVVVRDYTPAEWRPYVQQTVNAFNDMLPKRAPRLVYEPFDERPCADLRVKRGFVVCADFGDTPGDAELTTIGNRIVRAIVRVTPQNVPYPLGLLCHEFMHATTDVPDDPSHPHDADSCVQGRLPYLGEWDVAFARWVYQKHGDHRSGPRNRNGRKR